jgi:hypothetical protein
MRNSSSSSGICAFVGWIGLALSTWVLAAAPQPPPFPTPRATAISQSGQFIVHGASASLPWSNPASERQIRPVGDQTSISLRPDTLTVTCERLRKTINSRLGFPQRPGCKVHLNLHPPGRNEGPISIIPRAYGDGWQFYLDLPETVEWPRLVRALVEVTLLDHANFSNPSDHLAQLPLWLPEGVDTLLKGESGRDLILESQTTLIRTARRRDALAPARSTLAGRYPLDFSQLALPDPALLADAQKYEFYRASAAVLVAEIVKDEPGRAFLRDFIHQCFRDLNWQTTFLSQSRGQFRTLLDIEKWWAVAASDALGHDPAQLWPRDRVLAELASIFTETADIRSTNGIAPARRTLSLGEVVGSWEFGLQRDVLQRKINQLRLLAVHAPPDLIPLLADGYQTLDRYLLTRQNAGRDLDSRGALEPRTRLLVRGTVRRLAELDRQIAAALSKSRRSS